MDKKTLDKQTNKNQILDTDNKTEIRADKKIESAI